MTNSLPLLSWAGRVLKDYRRNARLKGLVWALTKPEFLRIISKPCHYCGSPPMQQTPVVNGVRRLTKEKLNGVDRKDHKQGYFKANCVPCCKHCNFAKGILSESDFIEHCKKILKYWSEHER